MTWLLIGLSLQVHNTGDKTYLLFDQGQRFNKKKHTIVTTHWGSVYIIVYMGLRSYAIPECYLQSQQHHQLTIYLFRSNHIVF